jgi:cell division ATPase FtsA
VRFTIAVHSGHGAPDDAIERLARRLGPDREEARFSLSGREIDASWGEDVPVSMESDERKEIGRLELLKVVEEACGETSDLRFDWYAVSARSY